MILFGCMIACVGVSAFCLFHVAMFVQAPEHILLPVCVFSVASSVDVSLLAHVANFAALEEILPTWSQSRWQDRTS